jgi:hypothetical protein
LLKTLYLKRPILQNKTMIPIFLIFSIKTGHKLVVGKVSDLHSPYFKKKSGLNLQKSQKSKKYLAFFAIFRKFKLFSHFEKIWPTVD